MDSAISIVDTLIGQGSTAALVIADEIKRKIRALTSRHLPHYETIRLTRAILARYEPLLARTLSDTLLAAWIEGANEVGKDAEVPLHPLESWRPLPDVPDEPIAAVHEEEPLITFPATEAAAKDLLERRVMTKAEFDMLADDAKRAAFTVARVSSLDALEKIRDAVAADVKEGGTLREFRRKVDDALGASALAPSHVETVYRNNVASAYTAGLMDVLKDDLVGQEFPYLFYFAIHDARARPEHLAMETHGIGGSNIYRRDDPVIQEFLPPWGHG